VAQNRDKGNRIYWIYGLYRSRVDLSLAPGGRPRRTSPRHTVEVRAHRGLSRRLSPLAPRN
jgi:hypothetical protein